MAESNRRSTVSMPDPIFFQEMTGNNGKATALIIDGPTLAQALVSVLIAQ